MLCAKVHSVERKKIDYVYLYGCVYHYGQHQYQAKLTQQRQADIIAQTLKSNQIIKFNIIKIQIVLTALCSREPLNQVFNIAKKVTECKQISNEKIKQTKLQQQNGTSFEGVWKYKKYIDSYDKLLVAEMSDSEQYVFKASLKK